MRALSAWLTCLTRSSTASRVDSMRRPPQREVNLSGCHRRCSTCNAFRRVTTSMPDPPAGRTTLPMRSAKPASPLEPSAAGCSQGHGTSSKEMLPSCLPRASHPASYE
eukprot:scaffold5291_cov129-Isochrysis_galbana.AAC.4